MARTAGKSQNPRHIILDGMTLRVDEGAEVPFRRISDSVMVPRVEISGVPGAINLQRNVWLWTFSDFAGGEGRQVFDSSNPLGPPTFFKTDGGVDVRIRGEFSLNPDEKLIINETGGGSAPTKTSWSNTQLTDISGSEFSAGAAANHVRLGPGDSARAPARTPGAGGTVVVHARFVGTRATKGNKHVAIALEIWNNTDSVSVVTVTDSLRDEEKATLTASFTPIAAKAYHYRVKNTDGGTGVTVDVKHVQEDRYATAPASPQDIREIRVGIGDEVWATAWDGTNTDILQWNFTTDTWDQIVGNMHASQPRGLTGSDQYMYALLSGGRIYRINDAGATHYANDPTTAGFTGTHGEPLGCVVANNRLYALYDQGLFELTLDVTAGLPLSSGADYIRVGAPGEFYKELAPDTTIRQHIAALKNGIRFFTNVRGEQTVIWEFSDGALFPAHSLPLGYVVTAIRHYANTTFVAATFTSQAATPAEKHVGIFYISSDNLFRFLGYLRPDEDYPFNVSYITAYGHDLYMLQGKRVWRYNLGSGGITLSSEVSSEDDSKSVALALMHKKFWVGVRDEGTFVADDAYPTTTMWLTSPLWDFDLPDSDKVLLSFDINQRPLPANCRVDVEYSLDEGDWVSAGSITTAATTDSRITVSTATTTVKFRTLQMRVGITSIDGVDTPRIRSVTARTLVLDYEDAFDLTVLLEDDDSTNRLTKEHLTGRAKAKRLWAIKDTKELVTFKDYWSSTLPHDVDSYTVVIEDPFQELTEKGQASLRMRLKVVT